MDQKRLLAAIAISLAILLGFEYFIRPHVLGDAPQAQSEQGKTPAATTSSASPQGTPQGAVGATAAAAAQGPAARITIDGPRVTGSLSLRGARLDDLVLTNYHEEVSPKSPEVRLLARYDSDNPYFAQWGWVANDGHTRVPDNNTDWTADSQKLSPGHPVTLSWNNGTGQIFHIKLALDDNYMFTANQSVENTGTEPVQVTPWSRIRRERMPHLLGYYILHEGFVGVVNGRLEEDTYKGVKEDAEKNRVSENERSGPGGWAGFTDKYWLTALVPVDQSEVFRTSNRWVGNGTPTGNAVESDPWQVDFTPAQTAPAIAAGATGGVENIRLFAGAKEVKLLDFYRDTLHIPDFDKAIDFGWFYFLTKPFFYAIDWLYHLVGNFGIAIMIFTVALKALFFPLANKSYKSMAKMKLLGPKMQDIKERYKDEPAKAQSEMMALYRTEKVNPAAGCLPMLLQVPVFFSLYKVLFVTIEMRHAPFFGWIHDLSAPDPTNIFNLFGLIPWTPPEMLHLPAWAIVMGLTMFLQQKLNPQPPDPVQARVFQFMPLIFTFMLAHFPAGLVIYWSWNNLLSCAQQWLIQKRAGTLPSKAGGAGPAKPAIAGKKG